MPSGFKTYSASIQVDLDDILKPIGVSTPRNNVGFKVGATDISQRYKAYTTDPSKLPFNTFFKSGSVDLGQLFMAYNFIEGVFYTLTVYSGSGGGSKESASLAPITASAAPSHYSFDTWIGSGITSPSSAQTTVLMDADKVVSASYDISQYILTVTDGTGDGTFGYFDDMPITASTAPSYKIFNNWSNTAGSLSFVNSALAQTIANFTADGNATAAAIYDWIYYSVQANNNSGGVSTVLNGDGSGDVLQLNNNNNQQYSLLANPDTHYHFTSWSGNTGGIGDVNDASTYIVVTGNATVTSNFALNQYTLTVNAGTGGGTQNYGYVYTVTATIPSYKTFSNWTNGGNLLFDSPYTSTTNPTEVSISANTSITANFDWIEYDVQATNGAGGTSTVLNGDGSGGVLQLTNNGNQQYSLVANPSSGYYFVNWTGNTGGVGDVNDESTYIVVTGNATVASNFAAYVLVTSITFADASGGTYPLGTSLSINVSSHNGTAPVTYQWYYWNGTGYVTTGTDSSTLSLGNSYPIGTPDNVGTNLNKYYYAVTLANGAGTSAQFYWDVIVDSN